MKLSYYVLGLTVALIGLAGAIVIDTRAYRAATSVYETEQTNQKLKGDQVAVEADIANYQKCTAMRRFDTESNARVYDSSFRGCIIDNARKVRSIPGSLVFGSDSLMWLQSNPEDKDLLAAALEGLDRGRAAALAAKQWYFDPLEKIANAHDKSFFMRLVHGRMGGADLFRENVIRIDKMEFSLLAPSARARQDQWMISALATVASK